MAPNPEPGTSGDERGPAPTRWERLKYSLIRPGEEAAEEQAGERSPDDVESEIRRANDKERAWGLILGPVAGALSFLIIGTLVHDDPPLGAKNHVDPSLYHTLLFVLLGLSVLILASALWRKRLFLGITLALYGLAVFNLHYWGFGVPFLLAGAWYLVRAYRFQQELKKLDGGAPGRKGGPPSSGSRPRQSKRYTPPS